MSTEWKPGDVANILNNGMQVALRTSRGWTYSDGSTNDKGADHFSFRPLVVIDPEDREQVEQLARALPGDWNLFAFDENENSIDATQAALREFANPTPPRPEEPRGLGAVVEDADGVRWVRCRREPYQWRFEHEDGTLPYRPWSDIAAVRVLSQGVTR